jgi:hypothetical protein
MRWPQRKLEPPRPRNGGVLNNPTEKIYPPYTRACLWYRPGGPRLAQLKSLDD